MNNIVIITGLLLAFVTGFFSALKSIQLGLKWQIQIANKETPELKPLQPITQVIDNKKAEKINKYTQEQLQEWSPFQEEVSK